jgi:anti-sigma factor RsiW
VSELVTEHDLQAYADGKLPEERRAAVAAWLAAHPDDAERIDAYRKLAEELRTSYAPVLEEPVPDRLQQAVRPPRLRGAAHVAVWVALGVALGALAGWQLHDWGESSGTLTDAPALPRRAAVAHATYSPEVRHPVEVGADQEAHLVAWLSKRVGAPLRAPHLEGVGYSLVGGRLLPGENGPTAQFMYQCKAGTRVTLYVRNEASANRETAFLYSQEGKVRVYYWMDRKLGYAVSSGDISKENLLNVTNAAYQQLNPP